MPSQQSYLNHFLSLRDMPTPLGSAELARLDPLFKAHSFFSAKVEDIALLRGLRELCERGMREGWNEGTFRRYAREWMREVTAPDGAPYNGEDERMNWGEEERRTYERDVRHIDSMARLKLIFRTQMAIASEYTTWQHGMSEQQRYDYPAWEFYRQPGAITKRRDHVEHEGDIVLKTDYDYWLARNAPDFGGFGVPWPPFGYNSWMHIAPVDRDTCESLGLIHRKAPAQPLPTGADGKPMWGLPEKDLTAQLSTKSVKALTDAERQELANWCRKQGVDVSLPNTDGTVTLTPEQPAPSARPAGLAPGKPAASESIGQNDETWRSKIEAAFPKSTGTYIICRIPNESIKRYGIPVHEGEFFNLLFGHEAVVHIMSRHGKDTEGSSQLPVEQNDFFLLPVIIGHPDSITPAVATKGRIRGPRYKVKKIIGDITYTCILEYRAGRHGMYPMTLYKKKVQK